MNEHTIAPELAALERDELLCDYAAIQINLGRKLSDNPECDSLLRSALQLWAAAIVTELADRDKAAAS